MSLWLDSRPLRGRRRWKRREIAPREVDVHARWKPEREAEEKRIRRGRRGRRRRDEDRAVDQKQLE
jgi:hypothetical protein